MAEYEELGRVIEESVRRASEGKRVGVAFSGGMDSGLVAALAKKYARSVTCYTCGTDGSFDVAAGKELAGELELPWVHCRISEESICDDIRQLIQATKVSDPFTISYELQLFTVCRTADEPVILTGQGSDEYFGGCQNSVEEDDSRYEAVMQWGIDRLMKVSVPCELSIARSFRKKLFYPYLDPKVLEEVGKLDPALLRPHSMEERKTVLKTVAEELGFPVLAHRTKKASQYGSGTTDLIRGAARAKGVRYNRYISDIYEGLGLRNANLLRDAAVDVRIDPILLHDAEEVLLREGISHSEAVAMFYRRMAEDGNLDFLDRPTGKDICRSIPCRFGDSLLINIPFRPFMDHGAWIHTGVMLFAAVLGLALGSFTAFGGFSASLIEPFLMVMLFLVFLSVDLGKMKGQFADVRFLASAVAINFVVTPVISFVLGLVFFGGSVDLRIGLIMLLVTPCTDWYLVFTSVSKGNVHLSSSLLPINLVLQILLLPVYLLVFMGRSAEFDIAGMLLGMAAVLLIPFAASLAVKFLSARSGAVSGFRNILGDRSDNLQLLFLCLAIVAMFASESGVLSDNLDVMLEMLVPLMLFFAAAYLIQCAAARLQGYPFDDTTSLVFTAMARNSPLSLAIAVAVFPDSPLIALVLVIGPLLELPVLSVTSALRLRTRVRKGIVRSPRGRL